MIFFCGLGGWTDGLLAEGYDVIGFDIERHEGSFYLWGDVPALMPIGKQFKVPGYRFDGNGSFQSASVRRTEVGKGARLSRDCGIEARQGWFNDYERTPDSLASSSSSSPRRKAASAMIAKIPLPLSRHIAATFARAP